MIADVREMVDSAVRDVFHGFDEDVAVLWDCELVRAQIMCVCDDDCPSKCDPEIDEDGDPVHNTQVLRVAIFFSRPRPRSDASVNFVMSMPIALNGGLDDLLKSIRTEYEFETQMEGLDDVQARMEAVASEYPNQ